MRFYIEIPDDALAGLGFPALELHRILTGYFGGPPELIHVLVLTDEAVPDRDAPGKARREGPDTARAARLAVLPRSGTQRRKALRAVCARYTTAGEGLIDEEIESRCGFAGHVPRRLELVEGGWLIDSGERRPTRAGSPATVWVPTEKALRWWKNDA